MPKVGRPSRLSAGPTREFSIGSVLLVSDEGVVALSLRHREERLVFGRADARLLGAIIENAHASEGIGAFLSALQEVARDMRDRAASSSPGAGPDAWFPTHMPR